MNYKKRQGLSMVLSLLSVTGLASTALLARKASVKEMKLGLVSVKEDDFGMYLHNTSKKDILKIYAPTLVVGGVTIASIVGSNLFSRRTEASLISMAVMADQGWRKYKYQVKDLLGDRAHTDALMGVARNETHKVPSKLPDDDRELYFEEHVGFFLASPEKLAYAYGDMNQRLQVEEYGVSAYYSMIYDFVKDFEIIDKDLNPENLQWGWTLNHLEDMYGYVWVHWFMHKDVTPDGKEYTVIEWGEEPILNPGNYGEAWLEQNELQDNDYSEVSLAENTKE